MPVCQSLCLILNDERRRQRCQPLTGHQMMKLRIVSLLLVIICIIEFVLILMMKPTRIEIASSASIDKYVSGKYQLIYFSFAHDCKWCASAFVEIVQNEASRTITIRGYHSFNPFMRMNSNSRAGADSNPHGEGSYTLIVEDPGRRPLVIGTVTEDKRGNYFVKQGSTPAATSP